MEKRDMLYEGKAKKVFTTDNSDTLIIEYKDQATAFNGRKRAIIPGKGIVNNRMSNFLFEVLERNGIETHYIKELSERESCVKKVKIFPIEVIVRNVVAGSMAQRLGLEEGTRLKQRILEYCYKSDALGDPLINEYYIYALELATKQQLEKIADMAFKVNSILVEYFTNIGVDLIDFKLEFGLCNGRVVVADEISPDTCRFWDSVTKEKLDKDRFRRDLGNTQEAYLEMLRRRTEENIMPISYKDSGVDVDAGYKAVDLIKKHAAKTFDQNVVGDLGSFAGFYSIEGFNYKKPVLVSGTDGVGTKVKYAFSSGRHNTVGIDCVAMCVNDVVCHGAKPLFFLDYIATGKLVPTTAAALVEGVSAGCCMAGCALIGGETAEMPGVYGVGEYDLAGFSVGIADRDRIINGANIKAGDTLIGLASSGLHSNGFSLVRRLFGEDVSKLERFDERLGKTVLDELLTPTKIYVKTILKLIEEFEIKGIAHITGGGFIENIPRIFPSGIGCKIDTKSFDSQPIFCLLREMSGLDNEKLFNTFNMGIGMVICVDSKIADKIKTRAEDLGEKAYIIGETINGEGVKL
ncbi:trifunctional purine biosynthetic protein adenosine-3-related [Holotrichia oblita]|nr:trifunctional purine biosynthetic protein adenosine-3-related [Holotrichia oblita]